MTCTTCQRMRERLVNLAKLRQRHRERKQQAGRARATHREQEVASDQGASPGGAAVVPDVREAGED